MGSSDYGSCCTTGAYNSVVLSESGGTSLKMEGNCDIFLEFEDLVLLITSSYLGFPVLPGKGCCTKEIAVP